MQLPAALYRMTTWFGEDARKTARITQEYGLLKNAYEMPNLEMLNQWIMILESTLKDVVSVEGDESVLLEALFYQVMLLRFFERDFDGAVKKLNQIHELMTGLAKCPQELVLAVELCIALHFEQKDRVESEKNYLIGLVHSFYLYGDPRGRGNSSTPLMLLFAWKLALMSYGEGKI